jgi:dolichol-phosphate mannosyltransferase
MRLMELTVIIPTYNEAENLSRLTSALLALPISNLKILVVDDNSPDGTGRIADGLATEYPGRFEILHRTTKPGYGRATTDGIRRALETGAQAVATIDADFSHPPELLPLLLDALQTCDVAMGSRYIQGGSVDRNWPFWRKGLSRFGNFYARTILNLPVHDVTGGFRMYRREALEKMPLERLRSNGYAFLVEALYVAYRLGCTFTEVPFYFSDRRFGQSKMSFRVQREAAVRVWQIRFEYRDIQGFAPAANP